MKFHLEKITLPLKVNWKISRSQTSVKENFVVHLETEMGLFRSEVAPNSRYGETPELVQAQFDQWAASTELSKVSSVPTLVLALDKTPLFHSLRFGLESAALSYLAKKEGKSLSDFLHMPKVIPVATAFSMPILPVGEIKEYLERTKRFQLLKIKVDAESGEEMMKEIRKYSNTRMIVDANEGWKDLDQFLKF